MEAIVFLFCLAIADFPYFVFEKDHQEMLLGNVVPQSAFDPHLSILLLICLRPHAIDPIRAGYIRNCMIAVSTSVMGFHEMLTHHSLCLGKDYS